jgi:hypothetical protein
MNKALLLLRLGLAPVAQVLDHVRDVRELLLEVAPVRIEALQELLAVREGAAEPDPSRPMPAAAMMFAMVMVHMCHLLSS